MKVLGINGVGTNGADNIDVLGKLLAERGHTYIDADYRVTRLFRFQTYDQGRQFEDAALIGTKYYRVNGCTPEDTVVIAHSRGGLVAWRMLELGYRFKALFLFRPAMNKDFLLPLGQENVWCIFNPADKAIKWGSWLPFNDFGDAGRKGIACMTSIPSIREKRKDDVFAGSFNAGRIVNIHCPNYSKSEFWRHSDDFLQPQVEDWAYQINSFITNGFGEQ